ncbi:probable clathrin assembly protein At4g32285 [Oryza brachyantha]|uniref:probable clathrin assembly protein At4g32285 n=1 Tax=Oryza brachyantha TaxID=4533 RepID=UPI001ADC1CED|nr:probable clathrin assembly protein At4g32285 [Oryza brachyantha]
MSIRKALGAVKDQTSISIAKVSAAVAPELDVAIVRATSHEDAPAEDRHVREVISLTAHSRPYTAACAASLARRLSRTRDYVVAAKCLALVHRLVADGDPHFRLELLRPVGRRGAPMLAALADFRDEAHSASWDHSAFVRAYADYLDHRARFLISLLPAPRTVRFADERGSSPTPASSVHDMDTEALLGRALQLRQLLDRFLACRPSGGARSSRVVLATLYAVVKESTQLCSDVAVVLAVLLDRFFDMDYPDCVKVFEAHVSTAKQTDELLAFYAWCDDVRLARPADFADVKRIDDKLLETLEQFVRERGRAGQSSPPPWQQQPARSDDPYPDMNGIKALPAPEHHAAEPSRSAAEKVAPVAKRSPEQVAPPQTGDLVDLREPVGDDQENKLALALFSGPPVADGGWVAFPSDDAPEVTSAWQTPAVEPGKADWELALVETASNLSRQKASMGGGLDPLLLHGMYDQGAVRQQVGAQAATGSASSVAVPRHGHGAAAPVLALPAPDGTVHTVGGDPFAASLAVPPPAYVQMAEMERKQQLLVQEQQMWAHYRQGGMQGQVAMDRLAAGGGAMPMQMPMQYGMPMASYSGYY